MHGAKDGLVSGGCGTKLVKLACRQEPHSRLSIGVGMSGRGVTLPWNTTICSPEQSVIGAPVAGEAVTAVGSRQASTMAKFAARKASDRLSDQCSGDVEVTSPP